jgi:RNA polymerase sigma factor (sigma-70 family)
LLFFASAAITQDVNAADLSNRELVIHLVTAGPEDPAWLEFFSRFQGRIRSVAFRALTHETRRDPRLDVGDVMEVAQDLTQDAFLRLINGERRALAQFKGRSENSLFTYLHAIVTNLVRDHVKKLRAQRRPQIAASLSEPKKSKFPEDLVEGLTLGDKLVSPGAGPHEAVEEGELRTRISEAVDEASRGSTTTRDRLIFRLYFLEGLKITEIASLRVTKLSPSGIEKRVSKIRSSIKKILNGKGGLETKKSSL